MWWRYRPLHSNTHDGICCYGVVDVLRQDAQHGLENLHTGPVAGDPTKLLLFLAFMLAWHRCHRRLVSAVTGTVAAGTICVGTAVGTVISVSSSVTLP